MLFDGQYQRNAIMVFIANGTNKLKSKQNQKKIGISMGVNEDMFIVIVILAVAFLIGAKYFSK